MRRVTLLLLAVGVVFLVWMLHQVGWGVLARLLMDVSWFWWPLILIPYGLVNLLEAVSWRYLLLDDHTRPSLARLFWLRLAGEALNQLTPTASLGGEAFKAARLTQGGVSFPDATASVVIHKGMLVLSLVLYVVMGLVLAPWLLPEAGEHLGLLSLAAAGLGAAGVAFIVVQVRNPCGFSMRLLDKLGVCPPSLKAKECSLNGLDARLASFYRDHPGRCALAFTLFFLSWVLHGVEVYFMFQALGHPISWPLALCLDALAMLFTALGFFIPAAVGVQEGGNVLLSLGFRLGAALGAAFSVMRRLREAFWLSLGLAVVAREK
jgi:uncharacterized membrane protein YbhN (UPF0104 family)